MSDEVKPEIIRRTQDSLSKYIKKPQLTEKLLKKPPFRFLHDIVTNVIKETGFLQGLFTEEELNHENIKDRDGKVAFLDKLINCVKLATGSQLTVRSTKIVAGLEPTRTNELLQSIGQALAKKVDSAQAVDEVLKKSSKKAGESESKKKEKTSEARGTAPKQETSRRDRKDPSTSRDPKVEKKDPSSTVKKLPRGQDKKSEKQDGAKKSEKQDGAKKSEKQDGAGDTKKRSLKEKEAVKSTPKPGKSTNEELIEKPHTKSSKTVKEEAENRNEKPEPDTKDELIRTSSEDKKGTTESEHAPDESNANVKLPDLTEKRAAVQEQHIDENNSALNDPAVAEIAKVNTERQRPVSALGRKRSAALSASKSQRSSEDKVEASATLSRSSEVEDKPIVTKADTQASIPSTPSTSTRPPSSVPGSSRGTLDNQVATATPIPLVRPRTAARQGSARPGAPRLRNRGEVALVSEEQVKPVAVNLIVEAEGVKEDQDEDENLVVLENTTADPPVTDIPRPDSGTARPSSGQGHLVTQILETQKELETRSKVLGASASQAENTGQKVEIDWEASRQRERGTALKEIQRLCESIQTVTRAAHPIGKLFDSLQEDVDSMQQELEHWQNMQRSLEEQLLAEEALSVQSTQPLKDHLQQLQQAVLAQQDQLRISKANILANDQRIHKMLAGGGGDSSQQSIFSR